MGSKRYFWFFISILVGLLLGALYGWFVRQPAAADMPLAALRADYKTDYVLMVAEVFGVENDPALAKSRLILLGIDDPEFMVQQAFGTARELNYAVTDIEFLSALSRAMPVQGGK